MEESTDTSDDDDRIKDVTIYKKEDLPINDVRPYILKYINDKKGSTGCEYYKIAMLNILTGKRLRRTLMLGGSHIPNELDLIESDWQIKFVILNYNFVGNKLLNYNCKPNFHGIDATILCESFVAGLQITTGQANDIDPSISVLFSVYILYKYQQYLIFRYMTRNYIKI